MTQIATRVYSALMSNRIKERLRKFGLNCMTELSIQFAEYETVLEYKRLIAMQRNRFVR